MTLQESIEMQERISKKIDFLASATSGPAFGASDLFLDRYAAIAQTLDSIETASTQITAAIEAASQFQQVFPQIVNVSHTGLELALRAFEQIPESLRSAQTFLPVPSLLDSLTDTLVQIEPYLSPEERENCENTILPKLREKSRPRLTLSDALSILSILLSILFFMLGSMPDDQAERIIQQQDKIIANQEAEIAQLREEDQALLDALDSLSDSINLLTDEIELLRDKIEASDDPSDGSGQVDPGKTQQDDNDTQN